MQKNEYLKESINFSQNSDKMSILLSNNKGLPFYFAYYYLIGLYIIFLRLVSMPNAITEILYGVSLLITFWILCKRGISKLTQRNDVQVLLFFLIYYLLSSLFFVAYGNIPESSWLLKDWLYSLIPILFYVLVRQTNVTLNPQYILKITVFAIIVYDVIALIMLFFPGASVVGLFKKEAVDSESVSYALYGLLGSILGGFTNVIALAICVLSPISIRSIYKVLLSVFFTVCTFMVGQRTPVGGIAIVLIVSLFSQKGKSRWITFFIILILAFIYTRISIEVNGLSVIETMTQRYIGRFDVLTSGAETRGGQWQILNLDSVSSILFGKGVGRYSQVNPYSSVAMSDAMLFRIFNEMGLIGLISFILFFIINLMRAFKKNNSFMIALILYAFMANCFNRVLFTAPMSIIPYILISYFNWHDILMETTSEVA